METTVTILATTLINALTLFAFYEFSERRRFRVMNKYSTEIESATDAIAKMHYDVQEAQRLANEHTAKTLLEVKELKTNVENTHELFLETAKEVHKKVNYVASQTNEKAMQTFNQYDAGTPNFDFLG